MARPNSRQTQTDISDYKIKQGEENTVHVLIEQVQFDAETGKKTSTPFPYKTDSKAWSVFISKDKGTDVFHHERLGYTILKVLYAPEHAAKFDPLADYDAKKIELVQSLI